ncbi:MAG: cholest-4-en-3-one 26-monooxygenase, partial [Mycobacterium sp.]|nr:cholest-4-en-3-one 26-monooxygenase [Mycobacterium sp.]
MTMTKPDVDLADGAFYADRPAAREAYRWMRANQPVFRDRNGLAAATTYAAVIDAERNPELFSNAGGIRPDQDALPMMIDMDDPAHLLRRKLVNAGFTRKRLKVQDASIGALCDLLIDAVCERGECDLVRDLAAPLPMAVIGDMLGVLPDERELFLKWSDEMMVGLSSTVSEADMQVTMDAFVAYNDYTRSKIEQRRSEPTEDLISVLVQSEVDGERLTDDDILQETLLILVGGDETTRHTISGGIEQLIRNRDQWDLLQNDSDLLPGA